MSGILEMIYYTQAYALTGYIWLDISNNDFY